MKDREEIVRLLIIMTIGVQTGSAEGNCTNQKKEIVFNGQRFVPFGFDPCTTCTCRNGEAEMCIAVLCSPPKDCVNSRLADDNCCEFMCNKGPHSGSPPPFNVTTVGTNETESINTTNLGLRLVASTVTSFLILALLLFMIHRLRQRRLLLMIRRINNNHLSRGPCPNRRFSMEDDDGTVGYLRDRDHVDFGFFEDPPPPYSFWKPPESYFPQGEAPPPYEAVSNASSYLPPPQPLASVHPPTTAAAVGLPLRIPSLSSVSLHANNFQMNDLGQECGGTNAGGHVSMPLHHMNVVGSLSSLSSQSEMNLDVGDEANRNADEGGGIGRGNDSGLALRSDATYEDCLNSAGVSERRISNVPVVSVENEESPLSKRRSYSDVLDEWHHHNRRHHQQHHQHRHHGDHPGDGDVPVEMKRRSLQVPGTSDNRRRSNGFFTDPTSWPGDAMSESSSSSSPTMTYGQRTASPSTSSDSSSADYDNFLQGVEISNSDQSRLVAPPPRRANSDNQVVRKARMVNVAGSTGGAGTSTQSKIANQECPAPKSNSLDRTLSQLKQKMSLKKKKKDKERGRTKTEKKTGVEWKKKSTKTNAPSSSHVPRISYVTDKAASTSDSATLVQSRPKSYDFGDLQTNQAITTPVDVPSTSNGSAAVADTLSLDSMTCSSGRASFGSSSFSSPSQAVGGSRPLADDVSTTSSSWTSSSSPPSSSSAANMSHYGALGLHHHHHHQQQQQQHPQHQQHLQHQQSLPGIVHARSASVCSETGERKLRASSRNEGGEATSQRRTRAHTSPSDSNSVRISLDLWRQNHESYI